MFATRRRGELLSGKATAATYRRTVSDCRCWEGRCIVQQGRGGDGGLRGAANASSPEDKPSRSLSRFSEHTLKTRGFIWGKTFPLKDDKLLRHVKEDEDQFPRWLGAPMAIRGP